MGQLPCLPIASSTTSYGRDLLFRTRSHVEETYTVAVSPPRHNRTLAPSLTKGREQVWIHEHRSNLSDVYMSINPLSWLGASSMECCAKGRAVRFLRPPWLVLCACSSS